MFRMKDDKISDVFVIRDENVHRRMKRSVVNLYSIINLITFEILMTFIMQYFFVRLNELFADKNVDLNLFN